MIELVEAINNLTKTIEFATVMFAVIAFVFLIFKNMGGK